jgi:hypothetical protein
MVTVTSSEKNGEINLIRAFDTPEEPQEAILRAKHFYPDKDIYVGRNLGACFLYRVDSLFELLNPISSVIDVREEFDFQFRDAIVRHYLHTGTGAHEMVHSAQAASSVFRRDLVTMACGFQCEQAIVSIEKKSFGRQFPFYLHTMKFDKHRSFVDISKDMLAFYSVPALAMGEKGEKYRNSGFYPTAFIDGKEPIDTKDFNYGLLYSTPIENSKTAKIYLDTQEALKSKDINKIEKQLEVINKHDTELNSIIEHMAQVFSDYVVLDCLKSGTSGVPPEKLEGFIHAASNRTGRRGVQSVKYLETIKSGSENLEERLAEHGLRYQQVILRNEYENAEHVLVKLGYHPLDPFEAYDDMNRLKNRIVEKNKELVEENKIIAEKNNEILSKDPTAIVPKLHERIDFKDALAPFNNALARTGLRYEANLPTYDAIIKKLGLHESFKKMLECESFEEIQALLTK